MISTRTTGALVVTLISLLVLVQARPVWAQDKPVVSARYPEEGGRIPAQYGNQPISPKETQHRPDDEGGTEAEMPPVSRDECDPSRGGCPFYDDDGCLVYPDEDAACAMSDYVGPAANDARRTTDTLNPGSYPDSANKLPPEDECDPAHEECTKPATAAFTGDATDDARRTKDTLNGAENSVPPPADEPSAVPETPSAEPSAAPPVDDSGQYETPSVAPLVDGSEQYPTDGAPVEQEAVASAKEYQYAAEPAPQPATVAPLPAVAPELDAPRAGALREEATIQDAPRREETREPRPKEETVEKRELADGEPAASAGGKNTAYTLGGSALLIAGVALAGRFFRR